MTEAPLLLPAGRETESRFFYFLLGALGFFIIVSLVLGTQVERANVSTPTRVVERAFPAVSLQAKSAFVYDLRTGKELYVKNADTRLPLASLTKLMSALVALDLSPSYGTVKITDDALTPYGDSGLKTGEKWTLKKLLDFSLLTSSNDGIHAIALSLAALDKSNVSPADLIQRFVTVMNAKASELNLKNTYFWNETGLDESDYKGGAYGSARDVSALMSYIITHHPEMLEATRSAEEVVTSLDHSAYLGHNTNSLINNIPGVLGSKTGFTDVAGGNLTFAFDPELGHPIVVTVLGSSAEGRFEDAQKLVNATMRYINEQ